MRDPNQASGRPVTEALSSADLFREVACATQNLLADWRTRRKVGKGRKCLSTGEQQMQMEKASPFHTKSDRTFVSLQRAELCQLTGTRSCLNCFEFLQLYNNPKAAEPTT